MFKADLKLTCKTSKKRIMFFMWSFSGEMHMIVTEYAQVCIL